MRRSAAGWMVLTVCALLGTAPQAALAHRFTVAFVAPFSGADAARGARAMNGFLVATRERDQHPAETSDGHLGGLDSHVVRVDVALGEASVRATLRAIESDGHTLFVTGLLSEPRAIAQGWTRDIPRAVVVDAQAGAPGAEVTASPGALRTMDGEAFTGAYRDRYGNAPDADAALGYMAARIIDQAVRSLDGELADRDTVSAAVADAARRRP